MSSYRFYDNGDVAYLEHKQSSGVHVSIRFGPRARILLAAVVVLLALSLAITAAVSNDAASNNSAEARGTNPEWAEPVADVVPRTPLESLLETGSVFPDSSERLLTKDEIKAAAESGFYNGHTVLQYAINELYARNHMSFTEAWARDFYNSWGWYEDYGYTAADARGRFNDKESANVDKLAILRDQLRG